MILELELPFRFCVAGLSRIAMLSVAYRGGTQKFEIDTHFDPRPTQKFQIMENPPEIFPGYATPLAQLRIYQPADGAMQNLPCYWQNSKSTISLAVVKFCPLTDAI